MLKQIGNTNIEMAQSKIFKKLKSEKNGSRVFFLLFKNFLRQSVWVFEGRSSPEEFLRPFFERAADSEDRRKGKDHICRGAGEKDFFKGNEKNSFFRGRVEDL